MISYTRIHLADFVPVLYRSSECTQVGYPIGRRITTSDMRIHRHLMNLEQEPTFIPSPSIAALLDIPAGQTVVHGLLQAGLLTYCGSGDYRQRWLAQRRRSWRILLLGLPRYGLEVIDALRDQGWEHIDVCDSSRVEAGGHRGFSKSYINLTRQRIAQLSRGTGVFDPGATGDWNRYDLVVMFSSHVMAPQWYRQLLAGDIAHVAVIEGTDNFWISPIIYPGSVRCLVCREHRLIESDPAHVLLASQLFAWSDGANTALNPQTQFSLLSALTSRLTHFHPSFAVYSRNAQTRNTQSSAAQSTTNWHESAVILDKGNHLKHLDESVRDNLHCGCLFPLSESVLPAAPLQLQGAAV